MADNERAKFSMADGRIEIEGAESFVTAQLAKLEPLLSKMFQEPAHKRHTPAPTSATPPASSNGGTPTGLSDYLHLYADAGGGKLKILKSLPGDGKAGKTVSAALLLSLGNELNGKLTTMDEVRATCTQHACLDSTNFAGSFKKPIPRGYFTISGSGAQQAIALTHPGRLKAEELAKSLNK